MDIVIAAEHQSIASLFSQRLRRCIRPADLLITENPDETGSFYIGWEKDRYVLSPDGEIAREFVELIE